METRESYRIELIYRVLRQFIMNIYTNFNRSTAQFVAALAMIAMLLSALPVHFFVAEATQPVKFTFDPQVTICHANAGSKVFTNPTVSASSIINGPNGHDDHDDKGLDDKGDIIPSFEYDPGTGTTTYPGKNLTTMYSGFTGLEVYNLGLCNGGPLTPLTESSETIVVTGNTISLAGGWWFNRDTNNATPIDFNDDEASIGNGSLYVEPVSNSDGPRKFIGEYYSGQKIADTHSISYDFMIGAGGDASDANEFYMNVYANFGESAADKYYDCKYDVVPTVGSTGGFTTVTFDPTQAYPVTTRTGLDASPYTCPTIPADMDNDSPDSFIRMFALNLGDTTLSDADLDGHFDKVVNVVQTGNNVHTTAYDFEPAAVLGCTDPEAVNYDQDATEEDGSCEYEPWCAYEGTVIDYTADVDAVQNDGDPVEAARRNPAAVETIASYQNIGGPEGNDWNVNPLDFFTLGIEGFLVYEFTDAVAIDQAGADIAVYEITGGTGAQTDEKVEVSVSKNGVDFVSLGEFAGDAEIDIAPAGLPYVKYVRLDDKSAGVQGNNGDGYDVDAIVILAGSCGDAPAMCEVTLVSDTTDYVVEKDAAAKILSFTHKAWTAVIPDAFWIWGDDPVVDSSIDETQTFVKQFGFEGDVTSATLYVASDNSHDADLNGLDAGEATQEKNFSIADQDEYDVTSLIAQGNNELSIAVKNWAGNANPKSNPAGLLYKLHIEGEVTGDLDCSVPYIPEVLGCTDDTALNYDELANTDDGSCIYAPVDVCSNIEGDQGTLPEGYEFTSEGICEPIPVPACEVGENLLVNGSFEAPSIGKSWLLTSVDDWSVTRVSDATSIAGELWKGLFGGASDGEQNVELDSTEPTQIAQTVTTIPGATYELRFDFSARPSTGLADNDVDAQIDGVAIMNAAADGTSITANDWTTYSQTFVADTAATDVSFVDNGTANKLGSLIDNAVLCYVSEPGPEYGPYCGDGEVNQEWEQCDGTDGCADYCLADNMCHTERLVKITMEDTESTSFDDMVYLGNASNPLPNAVWFNFDVVGDDILNDVATKDNGLAVSRDTVNDKLVLGFRGENDSGDIDAAQGKIETLGISLGSIDREPIVSWPLEDGNGNFLDVFQKDVTDTSIDFDLRADTGRDAVTVEIDNGDEYGFCPAPADLFTIQGYVWHDDNENEIWDVDFFDIQQEESEEQGEDAEEPLADWTVSITNGDITLSTTTDEFGYYSFNVPAGTWTITETVESGWERTTQESYVVTVPAVVTQGESDSVFARMMNYLIPTAHAQTASTVYGDYNFGNNEASTIITLSSGGSGGSPSPRCELFEAEVLGDAVTLTWETRNGYDLTVEADGVEIYDEDDKGTVKDGSFKTTVGAREFLLTVNRGSKDDTCLVEIGPDGAVLGESTDANQVTIVPLGAADAGEGGAAPVQTGMLYLAVLSNRTTRKNV